MSLNIEALLFHFRSQVLKTIVTMLSFNRYLGIVSTIALLFYFVLGLQADCVPPPSIQCSNHECHMFNYMGIWEDRGTCKAASAAWPKSEGELIHAVAQAVKNKQKIRVVSRFAHALPKLVCAGNEGLIISTQNYNSVIAINKTAMTITVQAGAMMRDVIEAAAKEGLAMPAMIYYNGVSAAGVISTGAHGSGLAGKGSGVYEYVVGMRLVVPASPSEGYARVISLTEGHKDLKAVRLSLGTLGAISEITFALEAMYKRSVSATVKYDDDLESEAESFLRAHEFSDIDWFPSHRKAIFTSIDRVPVHTPGDGLNTQLGLPTRGADLETRASYYDTIQVRADVDAICSVSAEQISSMVNTTTFLNDGKHFTGFPVIGFNDRMQTSGGCQGLEPNQEQNLQTCTPTQILDKNETVCSWDRRLHTILFFDVELRVPMSRLQEAIKDVKRIRDLNPHSLCDIDGVYMRSIKKSEAYLGPPEDVVTFELTTYRPRDAGTPKWNEDVYQEIEQMVIEKHRGGLHWGKSGGFLFGGLAQRAVNLEDFLKVKERFDAYGVFSSQWTDGLFGINGKQVDELRDGCALDKICKCREDKHCAPNKGYFCEHGRVWKNARVCRKIN